MSHPPKQSLFWISFQLLDACPCRQSAGRRICHSQHYQPVVLYPTEEKTITKLVSVMKRKLIICLTKFCNILNFLVFCIHTLMTSLLSLKRAQINPIIYIKYMKQSTARTAQLSLNFASKSLKTVMKLIVFGGTKKSDPNDVK